jgi:hypothetical protein
LHRAQRRKQISIMSDISQPVIDRVLELAPAQLLTIGGFTHIDKDKSVTLFTPPKPSAIAIGKLGGLIDLLEVGFEKFPVDGTLLHVVNHERVDFIARRSDDWGRRQLYVQTNLQKPDRSFDFGTYVPQEDFIIAMRSLFIQDSQLDDLVRVAGNLAAASEVRQEDDGFTQRATMKAGVVMVAEKTILPRVTLRPFRTFREVEQPTSEFVFRVKGDERGNKCALFEADGGAWKLAAIDTIKAWLANQLKGSTVEGLSDIPIIA